MNQPSAEKLRGLFGGAPPRRRAEIMFSTDVRRIMDLPVLDWEANADPTFIRNLTNWLKLAGGAQELRPIQAAALMYLHDFHGLIGNIVVGGGKTLVTYLAPLVMEAKRPVLLTRGSLIDKTLREFDQYSRHWHRPPTIHVLGYEEMGREDRAKKLEELNPDLVMGDEAHYLKNLGAGVTKRVRRYLEPRLFTADRVPFACMSGTLIDVTLKDLWHLALWAMPGWCPLPLQKNEIDEWSDALDPDVNEYTRVGPGALLQLASHMGVMPELEELFPLTRKEAQLKRAREGFRKRFATCPGVIVSRDTSLRASLQITLQKWYPCEKTEAALKRLRDTWETPTGELLSEAVDVWRHAREIICGFTYHWDPPAPELWLELRSQWYQFVRHTLRYNKRQLDTPGQVESAVKAGQYPGEPYDIYLRWKTIEPTFKPRTVAHWHSDWMLQGAKQWLKANPKGLVWAEHQVFGEALSRYAGVPFFHRQGLDAAGTYIENVPGIPCVVSIKANKEGRNLQHGWNRCLYVSMSPSSTAIEQSLGRFHREGQLEDTVFATIVIACEEQQKSFDKAMNRAISKHTMMQPQKLVYADTVYAM